MNETEARQIANRVFTERSDKSEIVVTAIRGGWRCFVPHMPDQESRIGASHLLIRSSDGAFSRCSAGTPDELAADIVSTVSVVEKKQ